MSKTLYFKPVLLTVLLSCMIFSAFAIQRKQVFSSSEPGLTISNNDRNGFNLSLKASSYEIQSLEKNNQKFDLITIPGYAHSNPIGRPGLPAIRRIISVPLGADIKISYGKRNVSTLNSSESLLLHPIYPAQESVSKSADPASIRFAYDRDFYAKDSFGPEATFTVTESGFLRGVRLFELEFQPIRYNPTTNEIEIVTDLELRIEYINADWAATEALMQKTASIEFENLYRKTILNWRTDERPSLVSYPTKMLILTPAAYVNTLAPFVTWKRQQGFEVIVTTVGTGATMANTTTAIQAYMQNLWNGATAGNPAPTYLLIVGDTSTSGDNIIANTGVTSTAHVTDLNYVRLNGTDYLPEMYYGRFSVSSATELTNIINKTLMFQKTTMPDTSYLGKTVLIAGVDATYAPTHGNGAINYGTTQYFNTANGITSNNYLYPASGSSAAAIRANANEGRGYMNYTAHGSETSWADPSFTVSDINSMTNTDKYFVAVGNCCITNKFNHSSPCFGEAIIRAANKGGVAYIGGNNNTYWDEDYWWAVGYKTPVQASPPAYSASTLGAYDAMFHTHNEAFTDWATTTGETMYMGNLAVQQSTSTRKNYYWEIYSIMGDPSLMPYYGVPTVNTATFPSTIFIGATSINVSASPYSRIAISMGGTLYGTAIVPANGNLSLAITPFTTAGTANLVITAAGKITRIENITIAPNSGPYVNVSSNTYTDANNNIPEYADNAFFSPTFQNIGNSASGTITATLSCATPGITITDNTETISAIAAGASVLRTNAFAFTVANNIVDQLSANFTITMVSGANTWVHNFTQVFNAPALSFGTMQINDSGGNNNGRLDPGESVTLTISLNNTGAAAALAGTVNLSSSTTGISIGSPSANFTSITAGGNRNLSFTITASSSISIGTVANFQFNATSGAYSVGSSQSTTVGLIMEDFESGNFNSFTWLMGGNLPWVITNEGAFAGTYAAKSGAITHSQSSTIETTRILSSAGTISFRYKVSSESGYDYLKFYIDGVMQNQWAGTVEWTEASYNLASGTRVLKWEYMKDSSVSSGSDCAWLDNIIFPASTAPSVYNPPQNFNAVASNQRVVLTWQAPVSGSPTSYKIFRNSTLLTSVTALTYTDNAVTNGVSYSYYLKAVYSGGESDPSPTITVTPNNLTVLEAILGSGTTSTSNTTASPINVYYKSHHGQSVYTAAELNAAGIFGPSTITQLGFNITALPTVTMPNFIVRMKHTSATNAAAWITSESMVTVYSNPSYLPTQTGYNMYTLTTPFVWNGTDNLVVDTAFGLFSVSYTQTGTVQFTTITDGYRYTRSDTVDQSNVFSGGLTLTSRPNLKLIFAVENNDPIIEINPTSLAYGTVAVGTVSTQSFTISNTGAGTLSGSITTPPAYSVSQRSDNRNTISFNIEAGQSQSYNLSFSPANAIAYNSLVVISSNSSGTNTHYLAVTGNGTIPPAINVNVESISANLGTGSQTTSSFNISNNGGGSLSYNISASSRNRNTNTPILNTKGTKNRSIAGSTLVMDTDEYLSGTTVDWVFTVFNASTDTEWLKDIFVTFPAGVTVNSATNFVGGTADMVPNLSSGNGITINWHGETSSGWGVIQGSQTALATVNVSIAAGFGGNLVLQYTLDGDIYGALPHTLSSEISLSQAENPITWLSVSPNSGNVLSGQSASIEVLFNAEGIEPGEYAAQINIVSNDPAQALINIPISMNVSPSNHAPVIILPQGFSFDKNGSLSVDFSQYISDADNDPLVLSAVPNPYISVEISGLQVTFGAQQNWMGSQIISFDVSDGIQTASASTTITVNPVNTPAWLPTLYPTNSATVFAKVNILDTPAALNDIVGAFVNGECRGMAEIVMNGGEAFITMPINLSDSGEMVTFKIYSYATDTIYHVNEVLYPEFGDLIGFNTPMILNGTHDVILSSPQVQIIKLESGMRLQWNPVPFAESYRIYASSILFGDYNLLGSTIQTQFDIQPRSNYMFYYVIAIKEVR